MNFFFEIVCAGFKSGLAFLNLTVCEPIKFDSVILYRLDIAAGPFEKDRIVNLFYLDYSNETSNSVSTPAY